jgi:hypothetical protein
MNEDRYEDKHDYYTLRWLAPPYTVFHAHVAAWIAALKLALVGGWQPLAPLNADRCFVLASVIGPSRFDPDGSMMEVFNSWRERYLTQGQVLGRSDVCSIRNAIDSLLPDVPDDDVHHPEHEETPVGFLSRINPLEFFSGPRKVWLRDLVHFCRWGEPFRIE